MLAKRFMYVCAGLFLLTLSYHVGARSAGAQAAGGTVSTAVHVSGTMVNAPGADALAIFTTSGDYYSIDYTGHVAYVGNVFSGGAVPTTPQSWGQLKVRYRGR